jgi:hypothetical protein
MSQSGFWKDLIAVLAAATDAQALPLLAAPLLTQMGMPADMRDVGICLGVNVVTSIVTTLRTEIIVLLDDETQEQPLRFGIAACCASVLALALLALGACVLNLPRC